MIEQLERESTTSVSQFVPVNRAEWRAGVGLGYFSLGLGLAELLAPRAIARLIGASESSDSLLVIRALGARELVAGVGLLANPRSPAWLWSRVAGDAMDLALLGQQLASPGSSRSRILAATAAVAGVAALDALSATQASRRSRPELLTEAP
jgi:hypothetical protein